MKKGVTRNTIVKCTTATLLLVSLAVLGVASPVLAFDPPTQDATANATDVILWHGDNVTIQGWVDVNLDGDVDVIGVSDFLTNFFLFIVVSGVTAFVVLTNSIFGKSVTSILLLVYGLRMAIPEDIWSVAWMAGVVIALIGTGLLFRTIWESIKPKVTKMLKGREEPDE
jgi:hypothetical protein